MGRKIAMLSFLVSLLTGCGRKPPEPPKGPGVSVALSYPALLAGQRKLIVKDNEQDLTSTTVASGLNFIEFAVIDASGQRYSVRRVTDFGRRSALLDMGTTPFRVFLEMKSEGKVSLSQAKELILPIALESVAGTDHGAEVATRVIRGAGSIGELIEGCRRAWEWR